MSTSDPDQARIEQEQKARVQQQLAFVSGIFQGDVTIHSLLESLAEGVVVIDNSGTILLTNTRADQMFGFPKQELVGKSHDVLVPERFRKIHQEHQADYFKAPKTSPMG